MRKKTKADDVMKHDCQDEIRAAIAYGIDVSMLADNINRTPAERIRRHQMALDAVRKMRKAAQQ